MYNNELYHHGRKGQKWGTRNGPPYPLYRQARFKQGYESYNKNLKSDTSRTGSLTLATFGVTTAALLGVEFASRSKDSAMNKISEFKAHRAIGRLSHPDDQEVDKYGNHKLKKPEDWATAASNANPYKSINYAGSNNCTSCAVATYLRTKGYDAIAKPMFIGRRHGEEFPEFSSVKKTRYGSKCNTLSKAKETTLRVNNGKDGSGIIIVDSGPLFGSHAFNYNIKGGKVTFIDGQNGRNSDTSNFGNYFSLIPKGRSVTFFNLDQMEFNPKWVKKYAER